MSEHDGKPGARDPHDGQEPDGLGTTDAQAGVMEGDIAAEPPRGGPERQASGGADPQAPARQPGGEDELAAGRDVPTADGEEPVPRTASGERGEDEGWSQPESSAQKRE